MKMRHCQVCGVMCADNNGRCRQCGTGEIEVSVTGTLPATDGLRAYVNAFSDEVRFRNAKRALRKQNLSQAKAANPVDAGRGDAGYVNLDAGRSNRSRRANRDRKRVAGARVG